ncbi:MAG: response regulator, partial [Alphaproteobacteria bacterium]|nr:response regulator [Alphaproteobacteria bacterium]
QKVISVMLSHQGHRVSLANNGLEAVSAVLRSRYDVILMDVHMPELDGKAAARRIRALPRPEGNIPIIALTADATMEQRQQCLDAGMDDYLTKPIVLQDLLQSMASCLAAAKAAESDPRVEDKTFAGPDIEFDGDAELQVKVVPSTIVNEAVLMEFAAVVGWDTVVSMFETLAIDFVEHRNIISRASEEGEIEVLRRQTQALNGALGQFGATKAQETALVIETLCKAGYDDTAGDLVPRFLQLVDDSIADLRKILMTMAPALDHGVQFPSLPR